MSKRIAVGRLNVDVLISYLVVHFAVSFTMTLRRFRLSLSLVNASLFRFKSGISAAFDNSRDSVLVHLSIAASFATTLWSSHQTRIRLTYQRLISPECLQPSYYRDCSPLGDCSGWLGESAQRCKVATLCTVIQSLAGCMCEALPLLSQ